MSDKQQTAVQYLFQLIDDFGIKKIDRKAILKLEKQQIIDGVIHGNRQDFYDGTEQMGDKYFNETFKNESNGK